MTIGNTTLRHTAAAIMDASYVITSFSHIQQRVHINAKVENLIKISENENAQQRKFYFLPILPIISIGGNGAVVVVPVPY